MENVNYYIEKNIDKYENVTYVIIEKTKVDGGFMIDFYNEIYYKDENKAKSKLNLINALKLM
jgi:hypothetical protein